MEWTGARYADGPTVECQQWIAAPPQLVWQLVSDISLMPELSTELQSAEWLHGASGPATGNAFRGRNHHPALGEWETTSYVVTCAPPREFTWAVNDPDRPTATWSFALDERDGGTLLRQWTRMGPARSGLSRAIERMPDKEQKIVHNRLCEFEDAMTAALTGIKHRAEDRA